MDSQNLSEKTNKHTNTTDTTMFVKTQVYISLVFGVGLS